MNLAVLEADVFIVRMFLIIVQRPTCQIGFNDSRGIIGLITVYVTVYVCIFKCAHECVIAHEPTIVYTSVQ